MQLPTQPDLTPTRLFNPDTTDFKFSYAGKNYLLSAQSIESFPKFLADKMAKFLADYLAQRRAQSKSYQQARDEWLKEIYIKI